jgi:plastocyanin
MPFPRSLRNTLASVALGLGLVAPTPAAAEAQVLIVDFMRFEPKVITVPPGTTVTWTNQDGSNHNVTVAGSQSGRLHMDSSWSHTFEDAGQYDYHCSMHPRMTGTVIVEAP